MEVVRGVIRNREIASQLRDFSGLRFGNITPTDIDGLIEYHNLCFIYIETKFEDTELQDGQRLAFERAIKDHKKPTLLIISRHSTPPEQSIDLANTVVVEYQFQGRKHIPNRLLTIRQVVQAFLKKYGGLK